MDYIDRVICKAECLDDTNAQSAAELWAAMQEAKKQLKEANAFAEEQLIAYMKDNGDIEVNEDVKLVVGKKTSNKQTKDYMSVIDVIYDAAQGDTQAIADCLASNPFKQGETQKLIGTDNKDRDGKPFFWREVSDEVEVKKIDKRFIDTK